MWTGLSLGLCWIVCVCVMGECVLGRHGEDGFQSCEGFDEWSTFSSADWTGSGFQDKARKEESPAKPVTQTGTLQFPENAEHDKANPWFIFNDCFQAEEAEDSLEVPTLSQIQQSSSDKPSPSAAISRHAADFWCHLQSGSQMLRLSGPKPELYSHEGLLKTLALTHPDPSASSQTSGLSDLELENPEDPPGALIQTKLMPSTHCRNAPGFFYQISRQWLNQYKRDPLQ